MNFLSEMHECPTTSYCKTCKSHFDVYFCWSVNKTASVQLSFIAPLGNRRVSDRRKNMVKTD